MQQYAVDFMLHVVFGVYSELYFSVSLRQCSAFASVFWLHALRITYSCVVGVWFALVCLRMLWCIYLYALYLARCGWCRRIYTTWLETCMSPSATCSATCSASKCIVNVCNNTLLHALNFVGSYIYMWLIWTSHIHIFTIRSCYLNPL